MDSRSRIRSFWTVGLVVVITAISACGGTTSTASPQVTDGISTAAPSAPGQTPPPSGLAASPGPPGDAPSLPPPGEVLAPAAAAAAVLDAPDDPARTAAVLAILDGINLGVYTPDGEPIVGGAERSEGDVWAYDFEVAGLAAGVRDGDEITLDSIASDLVALADADGGAAFTAADITRAVQQAAASVATDPGQPGAYALAVALELARQGGQATDLGAVTGDPVVLDPLTAFLVTLDLVLPYVAARPVGGVVHVGIVASLVDGVALAAPCPQAIGGNGGTWIAGISARRVGGLSGISNASFDRYLQGRLVGGTVEMKLAGPPEWHHGHGDANGVTDATERLYELTLALRAPGPAGQIGCGTLSGTTLPPMGAIVGADVRWDHPNLEEHAVIDPDTTTSERGNAFLVVNPITEPHPSEIGPEQRRTIPVEAKVNVLQALGGDLYLRLAGVPAIQTKTVHTQVSWHRSYRVDLDLESTLTATRGNTYKGVLGKTTATGTFHVTDYYAATQAPPVDRVAPETIFSITTTATPASTRGSCDTEWITEKPGASRNIDWLVTNLIVYPETDIRLRMEAGPRTEEFPDVYDGKVCTPGGVIRLGPSRGNVWETLIFLAYQRGIRLDGIGPDKWTILATPDTWARGGEVARWKSNETCMGYCKGTLEVTVRVRRLPGP